MKKHSFTFLGIILSLGLLVGFAGCKHHSSDDVILAGIVLNTTSVKKVFTVGDTFTTEGLIVKAIYSDETTKEVTDWTASGDDLSKAVESQTITISYTEGDVTVTETYSIEIKENNNVPGNKDPENKEPGNKDPSNPPQKDPPKEEHPVKIEYQITYETQFGSVPSKKVEQGYKLTAEDLPALTQTGYVFEGWNKSAGDEITADTKITANWKKIDSAFSISLDSGSELKFDVTVNGKNLIFKVPGGYTKYEWYVDGKLEDDGKTNEYTIITNLPYGSKSRIELPEYEYKNEKHEILVVVTAADGSKNSARATFVIEN